MAVAVDSTRMAKQFSDLQELLDRKEGGVRRYQVQRACVYATVFVGRRSRESDDCTAKQEALDWQADPNDVQDDLEVLHHLKQQAATVPMLSQVDSRSDIMEPATTLVTSVHSSSFAAKMRGRLLPSFHRCSFRWSAGITCSGIGGTRSIVSMRHRNLPPPFHGLLSGILLSGFPYFSQESPRARTMDARPRHYAFVQWQVDMVDLFSRRSLPTSRPGKRRRAAVNPFLQVSDPPVVGAKSRGDRVPHEKRFNGVRYRHEQRRWEAMVKPPKFQNKHYFGSFKVEAQAARAADAAFHHYGRPDLLNFPHSSPHLLATRPPAGAELDKSAKLRVVRDEAKWLASVATDIPLSVLPSQSLPALVSQLSSTSSICPSARFRSLTEIGSVGDCGGDEANDAVSQPGQWMQLDALGHVVPSGMQSEQPTSGGLSSVQITEQGWTGEEGCSLAALPTVGDSGASEMPSSWLDSLLRSPPAHVYSLPSSPRHFEEELASAWLEWTSL